MVTPPAAIRPPRPVASDVVQAFFITRPGQTTEWLRADLPALARRVLARAYRGDVLRRDRMIIDEHPRDPLQLTTAQLHIQLVAFGLVQGLQEPRA